MSINNTQDGASDTGSYYATSGPTGLGLQGAGRGRNSRRLSNRNPLGVSVNGSNLKAGALLDQGGSTFKNSVLQLLICTRADHC